MALPSLIQGLKGLAYRRAFKTQTLADVFSRTLTIHMRAQDVGDHHLSARREDLTSRALTYISHAVVVIEVVAGASLQLPSSHRVARQKYSLELSEVKHPVVVHVKFLYQSQAVIQGWVNAQMVHDVLNIVV